ncbi:conserved hypothetical protein [Nitrosococcus oceani ATCC 19707]|uniref:DUF2066 domain-containing protein n=2 Tax=Nitrosococcus oceani TaxID=1229 RepID=Q3JBV9_NITOC|nr:DUF2066 domain-containing protein [Nitrosococcus oceani]ABA57687.1 conserved hypothetical protein [Nitrosococcus oceani ATCC 19707]EDZ67276.1 hypothetical protein NOC27_603 [Nitrosococcus oceani AFC27]KFI19856.1 hypothetical protein IB75_06170 [Nitrosococcus oceani C-27]GEM19337.1 hypothetical protein NONS58_07210 [Nitrosococcus oceani]
MKQVALAIVIFYVLPLEVQAIGAVDLYEAQVPVSNQTPEEQARAVKEAFQKVLLKVMGNRRTLARAPLALLLEKSSSLVQKFRYNASDEENGAATFWVRFDPLGVEQLLRQKALPVWGQVRPILLLWVAIEEGRHRYLVDADGNLPAAEILEEQAGVRGMPVILPLWDLEDRSQLSFSDIWGNFPEPILAASKRYPASVQLVGRLSRQSEDDWQARWTLYGVDKARDWRVNGEFEQVLRAGIDKSVDTIAAQIVPATGNNSLSSVQVRVTGVTSFMDYARLFSYLSSLSQVITMEPVQLSRAEAKFRLELRGKAEGLATSIRFGRVLVRATEGMGTNIEPNHMELNYRLLP